MTPITRALCPSICKVLPRTEGEAPSSLSQSPWLKTTTRSRRACSSAVNQRPSSGGTPISGKKLAEVKPPWTTRGSPAAFKVTRDQPLLR